MKAKKVNETLNEKILKGPSKEEVTDKIEKDPNKSLKEAALHGRLEDVRYALENGADVYQDDYLSFRIAGGQGYIEILKLLIGYADKTEKNRDGRFKIVKGLEYAFMVAAKNNNKEIIKFAFDKINELEPDNPGFYIHTSIKIAQEDDMFHFLKKYYLDYVDDHVKRVMT